MFPCRCVIRWSFILATLCAGLIAGHAAAAAIYTFEELANGSLTGQDGWTTYLGNNAFNITDGTGINTSKVAFATTSRNNFSVRPNDDNWAFTPHSGPITAMQFDLRFMPGTDGNRTNSGVYFGLAADVDTTPGISGTSERGPAFGILMSQFGIQHLLTFSWLMNHHISDHVYDSKGFAPFDAKEEV
ncbi:MAG: hypothetical protein RBS80_29945, partial [Thermoguttaceae bacterium]|nr:hypothetical protein [Thermoguttaceae bacterium]